MSYLIMQFFLIADMNFYMAHNFDFLFSNYDSLISILTVYLIISRFYIKKKSSQFWLM